MNRADANRMQKLIREAIDSTLKSNGFEISSSGITFGDAEFTMRIECKSADRGEQRRLFEQQAAAYPDIDPDWYGAEVTLKGVTFVVVGINTRNPKNRISMIRKFDGAKFKCPAQTIANNYVPPTAAELLAKKDQRPADWA